jgi:hypothetical protein
MYMYMYLVGCSYVRGQTSDKFDRVLKVTCSIYSSQTAHRRSMEGHPGRHRLSVAILIFNERSLSLAAVVACRLCPTLPCLGTFVLPLLLRCVLAMTVMDLRENPL